MSSNVAIVKEKKLKSKKKEKLNENGKKNLKIDITLESEAWNKNGV